MAASLVKNSHRWQRCLTVCLGLLIATSVSAQQPSSTLHDGTLRDGETPAQPDTKTSAPAPMIETGMIETGVIETGAIGSGAMVFIDPETGELTSEPAPGQLQRLLAQGRALVRQRSELTSQTNDQAAATSPEGSSVRKASAEEILAHTAPTFVTPFGIGIALDDRFLHGLRVSISDLGATTHSCSTPKHHHTPQHDQGGEKPEGSLEPPAGSDAKSTPEVEDQ